MEAPTEAGELLTRWAIRGALALYVATIGLHRYSRRHDAHNVSRLLWTAACALYLAHVACAFHFYHDWSHESAYRQVERESEELLGVGFGAGLYLNYVFTLVWCADVVRVWIRGNARDVVWTRLLHSFMAFMAFQGTVVFEEGAIRWFGVAATIALVPAWYANRRRTASAP